MQWIVSLDVTTRRLGIVTERKCLIIDDAGIVQDLNSFLAYLPNSVMGLNHTKYTEMKAQGHNS